MLQIVGVLKSDVVLFADCYLIPPASSANALFADDDADVHTATLISLSPDQFADRKLLQSLAELFPSPQFTRLMASARLERGAFSLYLAGLAGLLLGGAGTFIGLFRWLASRTWWPILAAPLEEMRRRPGLVWSVHLAYFGLVILAAILVYFAPEVQTALRSAVVSSSKSGGSPLEVAAKAYGSGSIPRAAAVTFMINFILGSLAMISLPSAIVPGAGVILAAFRAVLWGLLLAPTSGLLATIMLSHSGTVLLEGEGYVLAVIFGLLIPIWMCEAGMGGTVLGRYARALLLSLKATALVALVLVVAACYEAIEVILMSR
jgi:hypothetical protein